MGRISVFQPRASNFVGFTEKNIYPLLGKKDNHLHQEREGVAGFVGKNGTSLFRLHSIILHI